MAVYGGLCALATFDRQDIYSKVLTSRLVRFSISVCIVGSVVHTVCGLLHVNFLHEVVTIEILHLFCWPMTSFIICLPYDHSWGLFVTLGTTFAL